MKHFFHLKSFDVPKKSQGSAGTKLQTRGAESGHGVAQMLGFYSMRHGDSTGFHWFLSRFGPENVGYIYSQ